VLPDEFFTDPVPTTIGDSYQVSGPRVNVAFRAERQALDDVRVGAKFGGRHYGIATTVYNVATAESKY
jgi:hypothetical protein